MITDSTKVSSSFSSCFFYYIIDKYQCSSAEEPSSLSKIVCPAVSSTVSEDDDKDDGRSSLLSRQVIMDGRRKTHPIFRSHPLSSPSSLHEHKNVHVIAVYELCPCMMEEEGGEKGAGAIDAIDSDASDTGQSSSALLTLNYIRYEDASSSHSTWTRGEIAMQSSELVFEALYGNDYRSPSCLFFNQKGVVSYPVLHATGIFSDFQGGEVIIDYTRRRRLVRINPSDG